MERVKHQEGLDSTPAPAVYFDLIGGTSTGGLIAILLGRLGHPVSKAIECYRALASQVFSDTKIKGQDGIFKATKLTDCIKRVVGETLGGAHEDAKMFGPENPPHHCKAFVCATPALNTQRSTLSRTYDVHKNNNFNCKIWEAARATSAAPLFFKRIEIGEVGLQEEYLDGALGCNNPVNQVIEESRLIYGKERTIDCVVSIGTGQKDVTTFSRPTGLQRLLPTDLILVPKRLATESEKSDEEASKRFNDMPGVYHRLNVDRGLAAVGLDEWERLAEVKTHTLSWLRKPNIDRELDEIVKRLTNDRLGRPPTQPSGVSPRTWSFARTLAEDSLKAPFIVPFRRDAEFIIRGDILDCLHEKLKKPASRVALSGLGGVGKSQLIIEYVYQTRESSPETSIFWVHAGDRLRFEEAYQTIALRLKLPGAEDPKTNVLRLVHDWLCNEENGRWLMILDNADNPTIWGHTAKDSEGLLSHFIPQTDNGSVLVTSRSREASYGLIGDYNNIIEIKPMEPEQAMTLLKTKLTTECMEETALELLKSLEYMPLAITQAAAYINHGAPRITVSKYLSNFNKGTQHVMNLLGRDQQDFRRNRDSKNAMLTTLQMSFDQILEARHSAAELLSLFGYYDRHLIPGSLLRTKKVNVQGTRGNKVINGEDADILEAELHLQDDQHYYQSDGEDSWGMPSGDEDDLGDTGYVDLDDPKSVNDTDQILRKAAGRDLHPTEDAVVIDLDFEDDCAMLRDYCLIEPDGDGGLFSMHRLVQLAVKSWVQSRQETVRWQTTALLRVSEAFPTSKFENWGECQSLLLHAKTVLDYHPVGVLVSNNQMSQTSKFFWTERASLLEKTGSFLKDRRGLFSKAEVMFREALDIREKILGASHENTLKALETLGGIYIPLGRPVEAEALYRQLLERRNLLFEPRHRDTIIATRRLGVALANQGKFVEAERVFCDVYNSSKQRLGPTHDITLAAVNNLGYLQFNQGNFDAAVATLRLAVEDSKAALGENHPDTLVCMSSLTDALRSQGDLESAEHYGRLTLSGREGLYGKDHLETLESQYILAQVFLQHERYKEAEQAHNQVLRRRIKALGAHHPHTFESMTGLAWALFYEKRYSPALDLSQKALAGREKLLGKDHPDYFRSVYLSARLQHVKKENSLAEPMYRKACGGFEQVLGAGHAETKKASTDFEHLLEEMKEMEGLIRM